MNQQEREAMENGGQRSSAAIAEEKALREMDNAQFQDMLENLW